jgi:hypothetical protein
MANEEEEFLDDEEEDEDFDLEAEEEMEEEKPKKSKKSSKKSSKKRKPKASDEVQWAAEPQGQRCMLWSPSETLLFMRSLPCVHCDPM